jgi:hypothetical protein
MVISKVDSQQSTVDSRSAVESGQRVVSRRRWLRYLLLLGVLAMLVAPSCTPGFDPPSKVNSLRILAVTIDKPYAVPGDDVTLRMTVHDGLGSDEGNERSLQVLWIAGCYDPEGDQFFLCFESLAETFGPLANGGLPPPDLVQLQTLTPELNGVPDALEFTFNMPEDIVSRRPVPDAGPHYGIAYVFFAACAGTLTPTELTSLGGEVPEFPLECLDDAGTKLGPESFVIGYTQVYAFADERTNVNPMMAAVTLDGVALPDDVNTAPVVEACPVSEQDRRVGGCGSEDPAAVCRTYQVSALISSDVAEIDADEVDLEGNPLQEIVWLSYFVDGGDISPSLSLVSDATKGFQSGFESEWVPPSEPGIYNIWLVTRDQRGGSSILRRQVRVE